MKRILPFLIIILCGGSVRGQAVVHDPIHMGSNVVAFGKELQESMQQTQQFFQLIGITQKTWQSIEKLENSIHKVSNYVLMMQEIEDCAEMSAYTIKYISNSVKYVSSGVLQPYEVQSMLRIYTDNLRQVNNCIRDVMQLTADFATTGVDYTTKERRDGIAENKAKLSETQARLQEARLRLMEEVSFRQSLMADLRSKDIERVFSALPRIPVSAIPMDPEDKLLIISKYDLTDMRYEDMDWTVKEEDLRPKITKTVSESSVKTRYEKITNPGSKFFYAVSALIGILGIIRLYTRWNTGEDIAKTAFIWMGTTLFLFIIGYIIPIFF